MKKINIIKKTYEINKILTTGKKISNKYIYIFIKDNDLMRDRFAVCVSKKLGNAVTRNKNKRQIKDIIDKSNLMFSSNKDYVIILRKEIKDLNYNEKKYNLIELLKGELNEKK